MKHTKFRPRSADLFDVITRRQIRGSVSRIEKMIEERKISYLEASITHHPVRGWVAIGLDGSVVQKKYSVNGLFGSRRNAAIALLTDHRLNQQRKAVEQNAK